MLDPMSREIKPRSIRPFWVWIKISYCYYHRYFHRHCRLIAIALELQAVSLFSCKSPLCGARNMLSIKRLTCYFAGGTEDQSLYRLPTRVRLPPCHFVWAEDLKSNCCTYMHCIHCRSKGLNVFRIVDQSGQIRSGST